MTRRLKNVADSEFESDPRPYRCRAGRGCYAYALIPGIVINLINSEGCSWDLIQGPQ